MATTRHHYVRYLDEEVGARGVGETADLRHPSIDDAEALAALMLDAYLDTIDYEGETIEEARQEVSEYFASDPALRASWVMFERHALVCAVLVAANPEPLVGSIMTAAHAKSRGLASRLLRRSLGSLAAAGEPVVHAWITEGNTPSERIFLRAGFVREEPRPEPQSGQ